MPFPPRRRLRRSGGVGRLGSNSIGTSLLTAVAVSSFIGGGSAAAPKPLMEVDNLVASPAQVEHVDSRHADVPDVIPRRVELHRRVFVSTLVVALSSLAVVYLVVQCTRFLSKLNSAPFGQQRLLADGGVDPSCGEGAVGGEDPAAPSELVPSTLAERVAVQRSNLQVTEEDRAGLPEAAFLNVLEARQILQYAEDRVAAARQRLVQAEQQITIFNQNVMYPGATPSPKDLAALDRLEQKKQECQQKFHQEQEFLDSIAYQPSQERRAFLKYAGSQTSSSPITERVAEILAASERVLNPGKVLPDIASSTETFALIKMSDILKEELEELAGMLLGARDLPKGMDYRAVRSKAEARVEYGAQFHRKLAEVGVPESSARVQGSLNILRDALMKTSSQPPPSSLPPSLEQGMAGLSLGNEDLQAEIRELKHDEVILLSTSKAASKAAAPNPAHDEGWMLMHSRFSDLAATFVVSSNRTVSPNVPEDVKKAYATAVAMCEAAIERLGEKLRPFWKRKTQQMESELVKAHTEVLNAEEKRLGELPEGDGDDSPVVDVAQNCRARVRAATEWLDRLSPLEKAYPFVSKIIGKDLARLSSTITSADSAVPHLLDRQAQALTTLAVAELGRAQSHPLGKLPLTDGLRMQRILEAGQEDVKAIKKMLPEYPKSVDFLQANLSALKKAVDAHMDPTASSSSGSTRKKRSTRLLRKGDSDGKK
ncbi:hypothetical protein Emed_007490 [Eimeria media]